MATASSAPPRPSAPQRGYPAWSPPAGLGALDRLRERALVVLGAFAAGGHLPPPPGGGDPDPGPAAPRSDRAFWKR
jgi:hypothetical protein